MSKVDKFILMFVEFRFSGFLNPIKIKEEFVLRINDKDIAKHMSLYLGSIIFHGVRKIIIRSRKTFDLFLHTD